MGARMLRKGLAVAVILLFIGMCVVPSTAVQEFKYVSTVSFDGNTLYVGGSGPNNYTTIQSAINDASEGDTVFVYDDSSPYYETLKIDVSIDLIGEDKYTTVIDADHNGTPVNITADGCLVSGFTIQNCARDYSHPYENSVIILYGCENVVIRDNRLTIGAFANSIVAGVYLYDSYYCTIQVNIIFDEDITGRTSGIALSGSSSYNIVTRNNISGYCHGVYTIWYSSCENNNISENHIHHNLHGIAIIGNNYNQIINNIIENNEYEGILLVDTHHTTIIGNNIRYNGRGLEFDSGITLRDESCNDNIVSGNVISNNNPTGINVVYAFDNVITRNNLIDNYGDWSSPDRYWGNAYFYYGWDFFKANNWDGNYWSDSITGGLFPKIIRGNVVFFLIEIRWINIDWTPAQEPYDIEVL